MRSGGMTPEGAFFLLWFFSLAADHSKSLLYLINWGVSPENTAEGFELNGDLSDGYRVLI